MPGCNVWSGAGGDEAVAAAAAIDAPPHAQLLPWPKAHRSITVPSGRFAASVICSALTSKRTKLYVDSTFRVLGLGDMSL